MIGRPGRHGGDSSGWLFVAMGMSLLGIMMGLIAVTGRLGPVSIPIWAIAIAGLTAIGRGPIGKALAARIHPDTALAAGEERPEIPEELYAELDELRARVGELEERQEFSERLLARRADEKDPA